MSSLSHKCISSIFAKSTRKERRAILLSLLPYMSNDELNDMSYLLQSSTISKSCVKCNVKHKLHMMHKVLTYYWSTSWTNQRIIRTTYRHLCNDCYYVKRVCEFCKSDDHQKYEYYISYDNAFITICDECTGNAVYL